MVIGGGGLTAGLPPPAFTFCFYFLIGSPCYLLSLLFLGSSYLFFLIHRGLVPVCFFLYAWLCCAVLLATYSCLFFHMHRFFGFICFIDIFGFGFALLVVIEYSMWLVEVNVNVVRIAGWRRCAVRVLPPAPPTRFLFFNSTAPGRSCYLNIAKALGLIHEDKLKVKSQPTLFIGFDPAFWK